MASPAREPSIELARLVGSIVGGKYRVECLIGQGGMGAVFQATNLAIGKRVALKFLDAEAARDGDAATRFQREAEAASLVESAHIVQIFDSGTTEDKLPFLVMELLTGEDLRARLKREGRLPARTAARIGVQVLKALVRAHAAGIVHRDLKPDNVYLCRRDDDPEFVKIVDFGISKLARSAGADTLTHKGTVLGTAYYMSPEQAQSFPDIDGRTDLFSLGAILYEALAGSPPHGGPTYEAVLIAICTKDAPPLRERAPEVPAELARVVHKALARDREQRFQTAEEFLNALEALATESNAGSAGTVASASRTRPKRQGTLVAGLFAGLFGFALTAYFLTRARTGAQAEASPVNATTATPSFTLPPIPSVAGRKGPPTADPEPSQPLAPVGAAQTPSALPSGETPKAAVKANPAKKRASGVLSGLPLSNKEP
jgi:serine/threonine protein kinase